MKSGRTATGCVAAITVAVLLFFGYGAVEAWSGREFELEILDAGRDQTLLIPNKWHEAHLSVHISGEVDEEAEISFLAKREFYTGRGFGTAIKKGVVNERIGGEFLVADDFARAEYKHRKARSGRLALRYRWVRTRIVSQSTVVVVMNLASWAVLTVLVVLSWRNRVALSAVFGLQTSRLALVCASYNLLFFGLSYLLVPLFSLRPADWLLKLNPIFATIISYPVPWWADRPAKWATSLLLPSFFSRDIRFGVEYGIFGGMFLAVLTAAWALCGAFVGQTMDQLVNRRKRVDA